MENIRKPENIINTCVLTEVTKLLHKSYDRKKYIIKSLLNPKSLNCKTLCTTLIEMGVREDLLTERKKEQANVSRNIGTSWNFLFPYPTEEKVLRPATQF
jgi:hypothetical protein